MHKGIQLGLHRAILLGFHVGISKMNPIGNPQREPRKGIQLGLYMRAHTCARAYMYARVYVRARICARAYVCARIWCSAFASGVCSPSLLLSCLPVVLVCSRSGWADGSLCLPDAASGERRQHDPLLLLAATRLAGVDARLRLRAFLRPSRAQAAIGHGLAGKLLARQIGRLV